MNTKAQGWAGAMVIGFLVLFFLIVLWNAFTPAVNTVFDFVDENVKDSDGQQVMSYLHASWKYFPILLIIGVVVFIIVRGVSREEYGY